MGSQIYEFLCMRAQFLLCLLFVYFIVSAIRSIISVLESCDLLRLKFNATCLVHCELQWVFNFNRYSKEYSLIKEKIQYKIQIKHFGNRAG